MIHELRIYTCQPGKIKDELERLKSVATVFFPRHGIRVTGYWSVLIGENNHELYYIVEWDSLAERDEKWTAFVTDPEWVKLRAESEENGPLLTSARNLILSPIDFAQS